jgi:hypothetical protein
MHGMSSDVLGLEYFQGRARPHGYVSNIRRLATTLWKGDNAMEDVLQNNTFRTEFLRTPPLRLLARTSPERKSADYGCLEPTKQRIS